ncbi:MAG: hypothetical protein AB9869_01270 [Verrucomicrobiia bacterium]
MFPDPVRILGRTLQPYCLGHALLLHRVSSPYVQSDVKDAEAGVGDLLLALYICSRPWQEASEGIRSPWVRLRLKFWGWQVRRRDLGMAVAVAEGQLLAYMSQAWSGPSLWEKQTSGEQRQAKAPPLASIKVILMTSFGCSEEEALSRPIRLALWDCVVWAESQGTAELVSDEELAAIEEAGRG